MYVITLLKKIENINNYADTSEVVLHLVDNNCSPKPNKVWTKRASYKNYLKN